MATANTVHGDLRVQGAVRATDLFPKPERGDLVQDDFAIYGIDVDKLKVWDARQTNLPGTAAADDLAIITGTFGTDVPTIQTSDAKATTVTQRLAFSFTLPPEYQDGESVRVRVRGGMITTVSDGTATVDVEIHKNDGDGAAGSDLVTTAATTINSLTKADADFDVTSTALVAGEQLDARITVAITDSATGTAVIGELSKIEMHLDIKG